MNKFPKELQLTQGKSVRQMSRLLYLEFRDEISLEEYYAILKEGRWQPYEFPGQNDGGRSIPRVKNHSESHQFIEFTGTTLTDIDVEKLKDKLRAIGIAISGVYASDPKELEGYFAVRSDILIVSDGSQELEDLLGEYGYEVNPTRSRYLSGRQVFEAREEDKYNAPEVQVQLREQFPQVEIHLEKIPLIVPVVLGSNDPLAATSWHLNQIQWHGDYGSSGANPVIAIIDQGVDLNHPDLNFASTGINLQFMNGTGAPTGPHGTPCAGIAGGILNNQEGGTGIAGNAHILPIAAATWSNIEIASGIHYAAAFGADVISMSFGVYDSWLFWDYAIIDSEILFAENQGSMMVAATGNENLVNQMRYPSKHPLVLSVGGSNQADRRKAVGDGFENWWGACYGEEQYLGTPVAVNVVAPSHDIVAPDQMGNAGYTPGNYTIFNGTSSATPIVAGLAALLKGCYPNAGNSQVKRIIEQSADKVAGYTYTFRPEWPNSPWSPEMGHGRVNVRRAMRLAQEVLGGCSGRCCCNCSSAGPSPQVAAFAVKSLQHISKEQPQQIQKYEPVITDVGNGWTGDTYEVPTDGVYEFNWTFVRDSVYAGGTHDDVYLDIYVNQIAVEVSAYTGQTVDKDRNSASAHTILELQQGDRVSLWARSEAGRTRHMNNILFSGHLVGGM